MHPAGAFEWLRRMGEHEAYHLGPLNRLIHWLCIPFELWGVIKVLSLVGLTSVGGVSLDLALLLIFILAPVYLATEALMGSIMVGLLLALWALARWISMGPVAGLILGGLVFTAGFLIQTRIGHHRFEPGGRDDTQRNIQELSSTFNPVPLVLVFYYHLVEIVFALGYRPDLEARMLHYRDLHLSAGSASPQS